MMDKHVRMTIEFDIDSEALHEHGLTAHDIFKNIVFYDDDVSDGFRISSRVPGLDNTSNFFLCDGQVVSQEFISERSRCDGLDQWRRMARNEIDINNDIYELTEDEKWLLIADSSVVDFLAERMEMYMGRGDRTEYVALEMAFENDFPELLKDFREEQVSDALDFAHVSVEDNAVVYGNDDPAEVKIFHDENDDLFCQFGDEDFARPLRDQIQDIKEGDAFLWLNEGYIHIADEDAHQNFDEPDECWVVHGTDGEGYFEEDIGVELGEKIRNLMKDLEPSSAQPSLDNMIAKAESGKVMHEKTSRAEHEEVL